jgi:hypothetical protein
MTLLVLGALMLAGIFVFAVLGAVFSLVWFVVTLPFRLLGLLFHIPLLLFGLAVGALALTVLVFLPLFFLVAPLAAVALVAYGLWRWTHRSSRRAIAA